MPLARLPHLCLRFALAVAVGTFLIGEPSIAGGAVATSVGSSITAANQVAHPAQTDTTAPPAEPVVTFAEDLNYSDCISALPKPGCRTRNKVDWRQLLVLGLLVSGLSFIGWRIARTLRRVRPTGPHDPQDPRRPQKSPSSP